MTATTDQISQYPVPLESLRRRRLLLAQSRLRSVQHKHRRPELEPLYFLLGLFAVTAFGIMAIEHCHNRRMVTMSDYDWQVERCR